MKELAHMQSGVGTEWVFDNDGIIHFTLAPKRLTGRQWIHYFETEKTDALGLPYRVTPQARHALFRATELSTNKDGHHIVVLPIAQLGPLDRFVGEVRRIARDKGWITPHWEVGSLIRDTFTNEDLKAMGLKCICGMHEPIIVSGDPWQLVSHRYDNDCCLDAAFRPNGELFGDGGVAFEVPRLNALA